ncbi:MAG: hypothetical protein FD123_3601 [Bacteroidetes bacterium]|nr:MAG: hypothetical protein FD123_3601 [Bacteroidota bacterium]
MSNESIFSSLKKSFYSRFPDCSIFDCEEYNLLKVVLDGLKVRYSSKGHIRTPLFWPLPAHKIWLNLQRRRNPIDPAQTGRLKSIDQKRFWAMDFGGRTMDGKSVFFERIRGLAGAGDMVLLSGKTGPGYFPADFSFEGLPGAMALLPFDEEDTRMRNALRTFEKKLAAAGLLNGTERKDIRIALQLFFDQYRGWKKILELAKPLHVVLIMHYHHEGLLLALRRKGIKITELQHGLIAPEDIFYMMPKSVSAVSSRALFADRILVYGQFWKDRLLQGGEYAEEQIRIIGYYHYEPVTDPAQLPADIQDFTRNKKVWLVCTQTYMDDEYCAHVMRISSLLAKSGAQACILVKPHPHEPLSKYASLAQLENVKLVQASLGALFPVADAHLSICSTTHYDALRYGLRSFALDTEKYKDYLESVIASGVAKLLGPEETPLDYPETGNPALHPAAYYYSPMESSPEKIVQLLEAV